MFWKDYLKQVGGSGAMWNMGQNETSLYFCMKEVLKLVSCKNMFHIAPLSPIAKIGSKFGFENFLGHRVPMYHI
jgi:hypothetical protein